MNKYFNDDVLDILVKENCLLDVRLEKFEVVAEYKFFKTSDGSFYLSIDPFVDGDDVINDKNNNFVRSSKIEIIVNL